ncbi:MAG: FGGY family carbohydrate kinase [Bacteroidia bacterium]
MLLLGYDIGSSSVKAAIIDGETGQNLASTFYPKTELSMKALHPGWAEQDPETWWSCLKHATKDLLQNPKVDPTQIGAIGISYQMHGLVMVDKNQNVLRESIIWCDSRAVEIGEKAFTDIGEARCLAHFLNSPGNFTASKLKWVKENEQAIFEKVDKIMLPGDYIAMKLTGEVNTTISGLSEGIFWDFKENQSANLLLDYYGFESSILPKLVDTFSIQGKLSSKAATELGLPQGIHISYRAGDQPNNALSLNVLNPGDIAATAGTSGVVYGVTEEVRYDPLSRVNTFAHVNHRSDLNRLGILLCVNGSGILNSWLKHNLNADWDYENMNQLADQVPIGSDGVYIFPFGNGAERVLGNKNPGASIHGLQFNRHHRGHVLRAAQEGIVFSFIYGMEIMQEMGLSPTVIRAGKANMFLSEIFRNTLSSTANVPIQLLNTDGAQGAARGAGIGSGFYHSFEEAFLGLEVESEIEPDAEKHDSYRQAYKNWKMALSQYLK